MIFGTFTRQHLVKRFGLLVMTALYFWFGLVFAKYEERNPDSYRNGNVKYSQAHYLSINLPHKAYRDRLPRLQMSGSIGQKMAVTAPCSGSQGP